MGVLLRATRHLWVSLSVSLSVSERFSERFSEHLYRLLSVSGRLFRRPERLGVSARLSERLWAPLRVSEHLSGHLSDRAWKSLGVSEGLSGRVCTARSVSARLSVRL